MNEKEHDEPDRKHRTQPSDQHRKHRTQPSDQHRKHRTQPSDQLSESRPRRRFNRDRNEGNRERFQHRPRVHVHGIGHYVCGHLFNLVSNYGIVRIKCDITEPGSALEGQTVMVRGRDQFTKRMKLNSIVLLRVTEIVGDGVEGTIDMPKLGLILTRCLCGSLMKRQSNGLHCTSSTCGKVDNELIVSRIYGRMPLSTQLDNSPVVPRPFGRR